MENLAESVEQNDIKVFGFWVYLMTDLIIFGALFATYVVLKEGTFGGPTSKQLFSMNSALSETLILLSSSFACSLGTYGVHRKSKKIANFWFLVTFALGISFLYIELSEFLKLIHEGNGWHRSAFLSAFFTLVGTHGLHISIGLLWMIVEMVRIAIRPFNEHSISRILRMALFWHFLDFVWVFIYTTVYGVGHLI